MGSLSAGARVASLLVAIAFAFGAITAVAAAHSLKLDLQGRVVADDGTPIAGASVVLSAQGFSKRKHTDARGEFKFDDLRSGTYSVRASAPAAPIAT